MASSKTKRENLDTMDLLMKNISPTSSEASFPQTNVNVINPLDSPIHRECRGQRKV